MFCHTEFTFPLLHTRTLRRQQKAAYACVTLRYAHLIHHTGTTVLNQNQKEAGSQQQPHVPFSSAQPT